MAANSPDDTKQDSPNGMVDEQGRPQRGRLPEASFSSFVSAMAGQTLIHLGIAPNPVTGKTERSLEEAKYSIDLLQVLRDKTKGNLTDAEQKLLDAMLYDLRMRYVNSLR